MRQRFGHLNLRAAGIERNLFAELFSDARAPGSGGVEVRVLRQYLLEFSRYIDNNADLISNYAERHRYGEVVSTAFVESTFNQVIAKRFAKKQQMQWTPRGVHLLMQLRTRVFDGTLHNDFKRWRETRQKSENALKPAA